MNILIGRRKAFTLIELLIVITIIGILAVALVPRITGGPAKARDAARKADLQQISTVLEFYADDNGGAYPGTIGCVSDISTELSSYLTTSISDPKDGNEWNSCTGGYGYIALTSSGSTPNGYLLIAQLENTAATGDGIYSTTAISTETTLSASDNFAASDLCGSVADCAAAKSAVYMVGR